MGNPWVDHPDNGGQDNDYYNNHRNEPVLVFSHPELIVALMSTPHKNLELRNPITDYSAQVIKRGK